MKHAILSGILALSLGSATAQSAAAPTTRVAEGKINIPTYALGDEDPNPPFPLLTHGRIYPYTMLDDLTDRLETKTYKAVFLENEYLKATVLPEMGGRLYSLYDKVSGREVFYRNNVIKYGLVALRGAWISGGIEFNFPDGHTVVTVSPVSYTTRRELDGGATVVVGDMDQVTGMHWEVALTLRPGMARLEQRVTLFNPTPLPQLYWFWANAAVPATKDMVFVYPMREAWPHARWPVHTYPAYEGVFYSSYNQVRRPTSLFGREVHRNFFGAYYQTAEYGVVHVADFREVPGKKIWTWGVAGDGLIWTGLLTDRDGPYNEIQAGRYETQLNYEFIAPRHVESWTEFWYPVRSLGGSFVEATGELALNARFPPQAGRDPPPFKIHISPVVRLGAVKIRLKSGERLVRELGPVDLEPLAPVLFDVPVKELQTDPAAALDSNLSVEVVTGKDQVAARWSSAEPIDGNPNFVPAAGAPKPQRKDPSGMSIEELFCYGVELEKEGREDEARRTYAGVLARDAGYAPALLKLAWWHFKGADFHDAEALAARAVERVPTDPEAQYTLGVVERAEGRFAAAADAFWWAVHYGAQPAPALAQLGEMAIEQKDYREAARLLGDSLSKNPDDALALAELAVALRLDGKLREAAKAATAAVEKMPLLPQALAERRLDSRGARGTVGEARLFSRSDVQDYVEATAWYSQFGDLTGANQVLESVNRTLPQQSVSPLLYYYVASIFRRLGKDDQAKNLLTRAATAPFARVFPNRLADALALAEGVRFNPTDTHAKLELGDFLFAHGLYDDAAKLWLVALREGFDDATLERNLGVWAWLVQKDLKSAAAYYARAIKLTPADYRLYRDYDEIYSQMDDLQPRVELFADAPSAVQLRDPIRARRAILLAEQGKFDEALELLRAQHFKPWEGGEIVRRIYVRALLEKGRRELEAGNAARAEAAFRAALEYPANLGVGKPDRPHNEEVLYWLGEALHSGGKSDEARVAWEESAEEGKTDEGASGVFAALSLRRLGKTTEADAILNGRAVITAREQATAEDWLAAGLAERALSHPEVARSYFRRALALDHSLWEAQIEISDSTSGRRD